jgi:hypothetical protein
MAGMVLPLPGPAAVFALTRSALDQAVGSAATLAALPARGFAVLDGIEALVRRVNVMVDRVEKVLDHTERIVGETEEAIHQVRLLAERATAPIEEATGLVAGAATMLAEVDRVTTAAGSIVAAADRVTAAAGVVVTDTELVAGKAATAMARAEVTAATAEELLTAYADTLRKGAPMASRFVEQLTAEEVDAAIRLVDELPQLTQHLTSDVLPILATLDRVGPDLHDLLNVTRDLKLAIAGIPGLAMLRRRGEGRLPDSS